MIVKLKGEEIDVTFTLLWFELPGTRVIAQYLFLIILNLIFI